MDCTNLAFDAEWFDEESGLKRHFVMIYFPESNKVQLFEPRTNKMFLKKSSVAGLKAADIYVGSEITILARQFVLKDFADDYTRRILDCRNERTFALVKPDCVAKMVRTQYHICFIYGRFQVKISANCTVAKV
jgi:nucleoside-diphosphate kinase